MKIKQQIMQKWMHQSLKTKWAFISAFVIFISYLFICVVMYVSLQSWLLSDEKQSVTSSMNDLTSFFESRGPYLTLEEVQRNENLINGIVDKNQTARILNADGVEILRINNTTKEIPAIPSDVPSRGYALETLKVDGEKSFVATAKLRLGAFEGYIQLTHPLSSYVSLMRYLLTAMILMGVIALVLSSAVGYTLATRLLRPLDRLRFEMNRVSKEGFEAKIELHEQRHDEIGDLLDVYRKMMVELENSFLQQQRFISDASHELRTPIQILEGHLNLIKRWGKDDPEVLAESLDTSLQEIHRMRSLIEELLDLARREKKDIQNGVNLIEETKKVINETKQLHPEAEIILVSNENDTLNAAISRDAYNQIVRNLLQNAIRYTEKIPNIRISLTNAAECHKIEVEDNGIGIQSDAIPRIFDRFFRVDEARSREHGGTGLGLAIVKMLVEKYDGQISVTSKVGKGTKFTVKIPNFNNKDGIN